MLTILKTIIDDRCANEKVYETSPCHFTLIMAYNRNVCSDYLKLVNRSFIVSFYTCKKKMEIMLKQLNSVDIWKMGV